VSSSREIITAGDWSVRARTRACDVTRVDNATRLAGGLRRAGSGVRIGRLVRAIIGLGARFRIAVVYNARSRAENARALECGEGREYPCL